MPRVYQEVGAQTHDLGPRETVDYATYATDHVDDHSIGAFGMEGTHKRAYRAEGGPVTVQIERRWHAKEIEAE